MGGVGSGRKSMGRAARSAENGIWTWKSIVERVGNRDGKNPSYADTLLAPEWEDFYLFQPWYVNNYREGWQIDKDLKVLGNKVYGPETCVFIPPSLNGVFGLGRQSDHLPRGVKFVEHNSRFLSRASFQNKRHHLGTFTNALDAHFAWVRFKAVSLRLNNNDYRRNEGHDTQVAANVDLLAERLERFAAEGREFREWRDLLKN